MYWGRGRGCNPVGVPSSFELSDWDFRSILLIEGRNPLHHAPSSSSRAILLKRDPPEALSITFKPISFEMRRDPPHHAPSLSSAIHHI